MDAVVTSKGHTMQIASNSTPQISPVMTFVKGTAGFAILLLCFAGAGAAVFKLPFSPSAQFAATVIGAMGGVFLVWYRRRSSSQH